MATEQCRGGSSQELQRPTQPLLAAPCLLSQDSVCSLRVVGKLMLTLMAY